MLFIANTIATIISCCTRKSGVQHSHQPTLLLFVVCVVIVTMICIVISLKMCHRLTKNSQEHQQQEDRLYEFDDDYLIATSNRDHRIGSHVFIIYCSESLQRNEKLAESLVSSAKAACFSSYIQNCLKRLTLRTVLLISSYKQRFCLQSRKRTQISFHSFYTNPILDVPNYHHYFEFIFILELLFRYLLFTMIMFINVFTSINPNITSRMIYFVYLRIYGTSLILDL